MLKVDMEAMKKIMIFLHNNFEKGSLVSYTKVSSNAIEVTDQFGEKAIFSYINGEVQISE